MKKTALIYLLLAIVTSVMYVLNILLPGSFSIILDLGFNIITIAGLVIIYLSGSLKRSWINIPVVTGIVIAVTGAVFKIQHWPGGEIIFFAGLGIVAVFYLLHFILKPVKRLLDYLKVTWLVMRIAAVYLSYMDVPYGDLLTHASSILLLSIIFLYLYLNHDSEILAKKRG